MTYNEQVLKEKIEGVKTDFYELHTKSQNRLERSNKSLFTEMDLLKNAYHLKIDESKEFIKQQLKLNNDEIFE